MLRTSARKLILLSTVAASLMAAFSPTPALGASASVDSGNDRLTFVGSSSESNNVTFSEAGGVYTIVDTGATISAGNRCTAVSANKVTCTPNPGGIDYVAAGTYGGDDTVEVTGAIPSWVDAGTGNDKLLGGSGQNWMYGNDGNDIIDAGLGADLISGGNGIDTVEYSTRSVPLSITMDSNWGDGQAGENDNVSSSVENLTGGSSDDSVTGTTGANSLLGGAGNDKLVGLAGDDSLDGGLGQDIFDAGDGTDTLRSRDGAVDQVTCGAGADLLDVDEIDTLAADCEVAPTGPDDALALLPRTVTITRGGSVPIKLACPVKQAIGGRCVGTISLKTFTARKSGVSVSRRSRVVRVLGRKRYSIRAGASRVIKVKISRNGRRRVLARKRLECKASTVTRSATGTPTTSRKSLTLKAPKNRARS